MRITRACLAAALIVCGLDTANAAETAATIDHLQLAPGLYMLRGETPVSNPSSVAFAHEQGVLLLDAGLIEAAPLIEQRVRELTGKPVTLIATSHHHADHTHGLEHYAGRVPSMAPTRQRTRLANEPLGSKGDDGRLNTEALPSKTFDAEQRLPLGSETVRILLPPRRDGHTDGDAVFLFEKAKVLYVGDYVILDKYPLVDLEGGGNLEGFLANVRWLTSAFGDDVRIVPGHGTFAPAPMRVASTAEIAAWLARLEASIDIVRKGLAAGDDVETLVKRGLPAEFASLGEKPRFQSQDRWIRFVAGFYSR